MKRILAFLLAAAVLASCAFAAPAESTQSESASDTAVSVPVPSALVMEKTSGKVLYEKNAHEHMPPASVTKIMTLLLTVEEIEAGRLSEDDTVTGSSHASSMGGSQIWLKEGETLTVGEMLKAVAIVSANDCAVALGEHIAGSEEAFVARMNKRAAELGMK
ncbi:MAG: D-alanyl-D-alanine carboxypeptidase family protein, partial [Oscillospiraceae bacterium]